MKLRDHPFLIFQGGTNWPPIWTPIPRRVEQRVRGEFGVLLEVSVSVIDDHRCYLMMEDNGQTYMGELWFDDTELCKRMSELLKPHRGRLIKEIAELDIGEDETISQH